MPELTQSEYENVLTGAAAVGADHRAARAPLAAASDQPRGKTTPESTPGSFAPADGGKNISSEARPADKADTPGDSGSSGASAEAATIETVEKFKRELPKNISPAEFDAILTAGFEDTDGAGNKVKYGTLLRDHINDSSRSEEDRDARKKRLGAIVGIVRETKPLATERAGGKERLYAGYIGDKAYVAVADEHNEIGAFIMVSYRRDGKHDKQ